MPEVFIQFPKTGLGNMMLVWARGVVFAKLNNLSYTTSSWWGLHWGALLRRERKTRLYKGYFRETAAWKRWQMSWFAITGPVQEDPALKVIAAQELDGLKLYRFKKPLTGEDIFDGLRDQATFIKDELMRSLTQQMKIKLAGYEAPVIGIHVRRGDFKLGNQTTPLKYFIDGIIAIRTANGKQLPVTVFTDALKDELTDLLAMPDVSIADNKPDILDIILLSKSKWLILSKSSTFSYWAAFLSESIVVRPAGDWQPLIKKDSGSYREINWDFEKKTAVSELQKQLSVPGAIANSILK